MGFLDEIRERFEKRQDAVLPLSEAQAKRLISSSKNNMDRIIFLIVLNSGITISELLAMRASDIDFTASQITIYTTKKIRNIKLARTVISEIRAYLGNLEEDRLLFPLKDRALLDRIKAYQSEGITFDWRVLRHTYADIAIKKLVPPETIANNIGIPLPELLSAYNTYHPRVDDGQGMKQVI